MNGNQELEKRLRAVLRDRAGDAPSGDGVAERVLAEVTQAPTVLRSRRGWGAWTMPLLAAAVVVAVIASVLTLSRSSNTAAPAHPSVGATHSEPSQDSTPPAPTSSVPITKSVPFRTAPAPRFPTWDLVGGGQQLAHFRAVDATFIGTNQAWLLGTADCLKGPVWPPCNAMVRTDDGGTTWQSVPPPGTFDHIRFATPTIGYAFSPSHMDLTMNGTDWVPQSGGADALETLDNNVIRVAQLDPSCVGACTDIVETSSIGSSSWTRSNLPPFRATSVQLQRTHGLAVLLVRDVTKSGPKTTLFSSVDRGVNWQARPDGCTNVGPGFAATAMAVGAQGTSLHLLCRSVHGRWAIVSDGRRGTLPPGTQHYPAMELGAADANTLFVVADRLYRSADGGQTWHAVLRYSPNQDLGPPEFESGSVGRWFTDGGRVVWKTTDSGRTWHGVSFSS